MKPIWVRVNTASVNPDDHVTQVAIKPKVEKPQGIAEGSGSRCNEKQGSCIWQEVCRSGDLRNNNFFHGSSIPGPAGWTELNKESCLINFS